MILTIVTIILAILVAAIGFGLLWAGWRGRMVDEDPRCSKCSYNLTNRPEDQQRCPECGAWITAAHAIRHGTWEKRPRLVLIGLLVALIGSAWAVLSLQMALGKVTLDDHLPVSWQAREIWSDEKATQLFIERLKAGRFSAKQLAPVVDQVLDRQANPKIVWRRSWGDIVELAHSANLLDRPRWERYSRQAMPVELRIRPAVRRGDPIPVEAVFGEIRVGQVCSTWVQWSCELKHSDTETEVNSYVCFMQYGRRLSWAPTRDLILLPTNAPAWASVSPGPQIIRIAQTMNLSLGNHDAATFIEERIVQVLLPEQPTVRPVDRPDMRETIEAGTSAYMDPHGRIEIHIRQVPMDLAFEVFLRWGEAEWPVGQITATMQDRRKDIKRRFDAELPLLNAHRVQIVLRPSPAAAAATVDITDYWTGPEIVQEMGWTRE